MPPVTKRSTTTRACRKRCATRRVRSSTLLKPFLQADSSSRTPGCVRRVQNKNCPTLMRGEDRTAACDRAYSGAGREERQRLGAVVTYLSTAPNNSRNHEAVTRRELARRLARLKRFEFAGEYDLDARYVGPLYFLPCDTLVGREKAAAVGVSSQEGLFGGVVPHRFV